MSIVSRRTFTKGLLASALLPGHSAIGQPNDAASVAIIDTPHNAAKVASKLAAQNVKVVVRFFARKPQPSLHEKVMASDGNMIDGVREPTVLIRNGLSIVSLYQYRNNLPEKFLKGLKIPVLQKRKSLPMQRPRWINQTGGQPEGSAFGVDFDVNRAWILRVLPRHRSEQSRYAIGVYGNGFVNGLRQENPWQRWISHRSFARPSISGGQWHLFQNQVDRRWFGPPGKCSTGLDVDTNLQNPTVSNIGAWGAGEVDRSRNQKIFDQRRFAIRPTPVVQQSADAGDGGAIDRPGCKSDNRVPRNANVRILVQSGAWSGVDIDEDGYADGQVRTSDLTSDLATMPPWGPS